MSHATLSTSVVGNHAAASRQALRDGHDSSSCDPLPVVIRSWGGQRVWCVWMCYSTFLVLLMLAPLNDTRMRETLAFLQLYWFDKVVHLALFAVMTGISGCALFPFCRDPQLTIQSIRARRLILLVVVVATFGISLEFLQPVFGRGFEWLDMTANLLAIVPGLGIYLILNEIRHHWVNQSVGPRRGSLHGGRS